MPRIEHKVVGEFHVFTSPDVPGLYVAHRDASTARASIKPSLDALERITRRRAQEQQTKHAACA